MKVAQVLNSMLQCGSLVDVTIYCDDGQVNAHKIVLAASSTYFRNLFGRMANAFQYPIIVLREMPVDDLKIILQFIYNGEVNVPQNRVDSLMRCANYLQIDGMASSANSLNAILASSSNMSTSAVSSHHQPLLSATAHPLGSTLSASAVTATTGTNSISLNSNHAIMSKLHPQYPPALSANQPIASSVNSKPRRRNNNNSSSSHNNTNNNNNSLMLNNALGSGGSDHHHSNTGKPRHTCHVCLKTFTHGFTLKRHMELHSNSRTTIFCEVCSKSYSCRDSFLRHKKSSGHMQHAEFHHRSDMNINLGR